MSDENDIDITGINKAALLAALFNAAHPIGLGFIQDMKRDGVGMTLEEAEQILKESTREWRGEACADFDYVHGRPLKVRFLGNMLQGAWLYDRDQGHGKCARIVEEVRALKSEIEVREVSPAPTLGDLLLKAHRDA
jgi:hypothetical protein